MSVKCKITHSTNKSARHNELVRQLLQTKIVSIYPKIHLIINDYKNMIKKSKNAHQKVSKKTYL